MKIVILGAGNIATLFAKRLFEKNHTILQIVGKTETNAALLAKQVNATYTTNIEWINNNADIYLFATPDNVIVEVASNPIFKNKFLIHTSGSIDAAVFEPFTPHFGVMWPVQSLSVTVKSIPPFPIVITASDNEMASMLKILAADITTDSIITLNDEQKRNLHVAAVMASNFTNYLYQVAYNLCQEHQLPFSLLVPLIHYTAANVTNDNAPINKQTGPAFRNDTITLQKHKTILQQNPQYLQLYNLFSQLIIAEKQKNKPLNDKP
jgi:predicted short-subunit dehydrogenase-like oxidoreductase (DUF2520 family)